MNTDTTTPSAASLSTDEASSLQSSLSKAFEGRLLTEGVDVEPFLTDWRRRYFGKALAVAQPDSVADVQAVVRWCGEHDVKIVPQGGNTGLSGGATPDSVGRTVVISLARLKRVRAVDTVNNTITVDAGCTLAEVKQAAADHDRLFPLTLPSEGSCTIGGNLSTNAGGCQVLRYGNARELCLGLEVVTADGQLWEGLRGLRKDNTGYDLRDLFVGAEGTLGVLTGATLKLYPQPAVQLTAMAAVQSPHHALKLLSLAQQHLSSSLTAFEMIADICLAFVERAHPECRRPFDDHSPYYVLLECSDAEGHEHATARFEALLGEALEQGCITDAVISDSIARSKALWALRENISEAQAAVGKNIKHDISVPISSIGDFVEQTNAALEQAFPGIRMVVFGHLGDGNLHYNVSPSADQEGPAFEEAFLAKQPAINKLTHDAVASFNGSISAEHGLGVLRRDESARYKSAVELKLMASVKHAIDPDNRMNPGKVLPPSV
ncbi:MAG: FAD-binding oxidoreductase [Burkholderiaceae bacterium]